jgi:hypothetical protein
VVRRQRRRALGARIRRIHAELAQLGDLRPGSLSKQFNTCGRPACRCKATPPQRHGPYYQLSFTWKGRSTSQFVRQQDVPVVRQQLRNYKRLRELVDRWVQLGMELSQLKLDEAHAQTPRSPRNR